ncbi:MAG: mRNA binding protein puf3 [Phylliscum demangeonii]|nr:MAG: mRNA binding protein puf3 [Phylliscum demangeonii]
MLPARSASAAQPLSPRPVRELALPPPRRPGPLGHGHGHGHGPAPAPAPAYRPSSASPSDVVFRGDVHPPRPARLSGNAKPFELRAPIERRTRVAPSLRDWGGAHAGPVVGRDVGPSRPPGSRGSSGPPGTPGMAGMPGMPDEIRSSFDMGPTPWTDWEYSNLANAVPFDFPTPHLSRSPPAARAHLPPSSPNPAYARPTNAPRYDDARWAPADPDAPSHAWNVRSEPPDSFHHAYARAPALASRHAGGHPAHAHHSPTAAFDGSRSGAYPAPPSAPRSRGSAAPTESDRSHALAVFTPERFADSPTSEPVSYHRLSRPGHPISASSVDGDGRRPFPASYFPAGPTPTTDPDAHRAVSRGSHPGRGGPTSGHSLLLDRKLRGLQQEQQGYGLPPTHAMSFGSEPFRAPFTPGTYDYLPPPASNGLHGLAPYMPYLGMLPPALAPAYAGREHDLSYQLRSPLLEEFRSNAKTSKRYELRDLEGHIVEFSGDQYGSRFIQQKLETANSDEKEQVFRELRPNSLQLMTDVFGNYVIQKFFEHGTQQQKTILAAQMKGHISALSMQMYGCRVVQKALEHILVDQQASLVREIEPHILRYVKDQNGNHVIQKAMERVPLQYTQFIVDAFIGQVYHLATHPYGCRVMQRILEHCQERTQQAILAELYTCAPSLILDQYGNYVIQHVIQHGQDHERARIIQLVAANLTQYSKHKFASNVVETSIEFGTELHRRHFLRLFTTLSPMAVSPLQGLMRDQYGNYVIQKLLGQLKGQDLDRLVEEIRPQLAALKKITYSKQIMAIEKLLPCPPPPAAATSPAAIPLPPSPDEPQPATTAAHENVSLLELGPVTLPLTLPLLLPPLPPPPPPSMSTAPAPASPLDHPPPLPPPAAAALDVPPPRRHP